MLVGLIALLATWAEVSQAATLSPVTTNGSALLGGNSTFLCEVVGAQGLGEELEFYIVDPLTQLSEDYLVMDATKYEVIDPVYSLVVKDAAFTDEIQYKCKMGFDEEFFWVIVSDPPTSMKMYYDDNQEVPPQDTKTNLTCESSTSRPPATFRWYRGSTDVTSSSLNPSSSVDNNGYAIARSMLELTLTGNDEGVIYTCKVDVPGGDAVLEDELEVNFSGSSAVVSSLCLSLAALVAALRV